ncbi:substrate-binding periplasmic protein [Marinobacter sediminum]|uniref:substrate-binding periplasmic protein n=1 Tax=Marinobacter sediminum TaxID=256323 RepID=UPI00193A3557|nr:transporter substrate-binding domain-containing protein [Marinobacter sediminum]
MSKLLFCLIMLFTSTLLPADESNSRAPLHFCNSHWPPYSYGDERAQPIGGYAIDFMREISRRIDHPVRLSILPWLRCLAMNKTGELDGIMLLTANKDRRRFLHLTEPLLHDANLLWYLKDNQHVADRTSFEELQGLKIGIVKGFNYGEAFAEATNKLGLNVEAVPTVYSNFLRLERGWIDVFLVNRVVADFTLLSRSDLKARLTIRKGPFEPVGFRVGLSKAGKAAPLLEQFNAAIADMTREGTVTNILKYPPLVQQVKTPD